MKIDNGSGDPAPIFEASYWESANEHLHQLLMSVDGMRQFTRSDEDDALEEIESNEELREELKEFAELVEKIEFGRITEAGERIDELRSEIEE